MAATSNRGKIREIRRLLTGVPIEIVTPAHLDIALEVEETGGSYVENARLKAQAYASASNLPTIGEDSGIEIEALGGAPGIMSARFEGLADGPLKNARVLDLLKGVPQESRGARYVCAIVLVHPGRAEAVFEGVCAGRMALDPSGEGGFGYDPIFLVPSLGRTMAQLADAEKDQVSHRGQAVRKLAAYLASEVGRGQP